MTVSSIDSYNNVITIPVRRQVDILIPVCRIIGIEPNDAYLREKGTEFWAVVVIRVCIGWHQRLGTLGDMQHDGDG